MRIILSVVWLIFGTVAEAATTGSSRVEPTKKIWYERANFYQVYPRSFKDSDGDGIGDLKGITEKVNYLKDIGIDGAWLSPIFQSPMADFGYDISDFYSIQKEYGTMEDFDALVKKCKEVGLHLILDFVPNHTSNQNEWFLKSEKKEPGYENFYVWHPGKINPTTGEREPPNNWISVFRFSAWEWSETRQEYYLHQFLKEQPDLNYREPLVVQEMKDVLTFWLKRGISGFRIDAVPYLFEDEELRDEPLSNAKNCDPQSACYLTHIYTNDQEETFDMVFQWRKLLLDYSRENADEEKVLLVEAYTSLANIMRLYGTKDTPGANVPFNFELLSYSNINSTGRQFQALVDRWMAAMPEGATPNWVLGNHDNKRMSSRLGVGRADLLMIFLQTMPGIAVNYYGDEIRMTDVFIPWEKTIDPAACNTDKNVFNDFSRDPARTPFQWDNTKNGGFSTSNKTWLPVALDYRQNNVKKQLKASKSHLKMFMKLLKLRKTEAVLQDGTYEPKVLNDDVVVYRRELPGVKAYYVILNFGKSAYTVNLQHAFEKVPVNVSVVVTTLNSNLKEGDLMNSGRIRVKGEVAVVLEADYTAA